MNREAVMLISPEQQLLSQIIFFDPKGSKTAHYLLPTTHSQHYSLRATSN